MIRRVDLSDAGEIVSVYNDYILNSVVSFETEALTVEEMQERINDISSSFPYFVYEKDGCIAGYCYAHAWKSRAAYSGTLETTVYLAPEYKGLGIGRELMERLISECRALGYSALIACITACNTDSIGFHRCLGFEKVSHFKRVGYKFDRWLDVVDYELLL
ncbi:GNAT family N-acetyltransferase [Xylanibacter caecicola]|uniref:GNAT family N-acetyltransferase n=1 Tax=Xylanibacter caecicola TaxID=2736294 RepID=UPI00258F5331|nr:GNAT family N-acetyltransferase [Xylanibacter caecicola]